MIDAREIDRDLQGHLRAHDPDPIAPRRKPERHEQQAGGGPDDGQLLGALAQKQAEIISVE